MTATQVSCHIHAGMGTSSWRLRRITTGWSGRRAASRPVAGCGCKGGEWAAGRSVAVDEGGGAMVAVQRDCAGAHDVGRVGEQRGVDVRETRGLVDELERARRRKLMRALERVAIEEGWPDGGRSVLR